MLPVATEDFHLSLAVVEELNLPSFAGECHLHHDRALPNGGQDVMGSAGIKLTDELMDCRGAHVSDLRLDH